MVHFALPGGFEYALTSTLLRIYDSLSLPSISQYLTLRSRPGVNLSPTIFMFPERQRYITQGATEPHSASIWKPLLLSALFSFDKVTLDVRGFSTSIAPANND